VLTAHHNKITISGFQLGLLGFDLFWTSSVLMSFSLLWVSDIGVKYILLIYCSCIHVGFMFYFSIFDRKINLIHHIRGMFRLLYA